MRTLQDSCTKKQKLAGIGGGHRKIITNIAPWENGPFISVKTLTQRSNKFLTKQKLSDCDFYKYFQSNDCNVNEIIIVRTPSQILAVNS